MKVKIKREVYTPTSTIGRLYINDQFECYTLEDVVRKPGVKVWGATAIPSGAYKLDINYSQRFKRQLPQLLNVPNFSGIRIHSGNTDKDTDGCILVGTSKDKNFIGGSRNAFGLLFTKLQKALQSGDSVTVVIEDTEEAPKLAKKATK